MSLPDNSFLLNESKAEVVPTDILKDVQISSPITLRGSTMHDHMMSFDWTDRRISQYVEQAWHTGRYDLHCSTFKAERIPIKVEKNLSIKLNIFGSHLFVFTKQDYSRKITQYIPYKNIEGEEICEKSSTGVLKPFENIIFLIIFSLFIH